jgi:hypothetical protein
MNFKDLVQSLLLYVGIPAATLYPLGFAALAIQLWNDPLFPYYEFDTIWYAVTLVQNTQVVGTGFRLIFLSLIATTLSAGSALFVSRSLHRRRGLSVEEKLEGRGRGLWGIYLLILLPIALLIAWNGLIIDTWGDVGALTGFLVLSALAGFLAGHARVRASESLLSTRLAIAFVGAVFAALCLAAIYPPSLPLIRTDAKPGVTPRCAKATDKTFVLLGTSSSPYWHAYNKDGLFALPGEELGMVQYQDCPWYQTRGIEPNIDF